MSLELLFEIALEAMTWGDWDHKSPLRHRASLTPQETEHFVGLSIDRLIAPASMLVDPRNPVTIGNPERKQRVKAQLGSKVYRQMESEVLTIRDTIAHLCKDMPKEELEVLADRPDAIAMLRDYFSTLNHLRRPGKADAALSALAEQWQAPLKQRLGAMARGEEVAGSLQGLVSDLPEHEPAFARLRHVLDEVHLPRQVPQSWGAAFHSAEHFKTSLGSAAFGGNILPSLLFYGGLIGLGDAALTVLQPGKKEAADKKEATRPWKRVLLESGASMAALVTAVAAAGRTLPIR